MQRTNKIQSETADVAPDAATWRTGRNICVIVDSGTFGPLYEKEVINKTERTLRIALPSEEDRAVATGNLYRKICEI